MLSTSSDRTPMQRLIAGALIVLQVLSPALYAADAWAQATPTAINPDRSVPGQRPVVNVAANGVPVIQVAPPSAAGVSNNRFTDYNVGSKGVILNNTGANNQTQLAGWIAGNPMLGNTSAKTILNQVTGGTPSSLAGFTEVAGNRANVIVANPNGITCAGCGFINAPRVTLTTGRPELGTDGGVLGFRVQQGQISMEGQGLAARNVDQVDLISRSLRVNAEIWANRLDVVTGTGSVDYKAGSVTTHAAANAAPPVSLDVSQLGGMYANSIRLVGTESGVGVNSAGNIAALTGTLEVTQEGDVRIVAGSVQTKENINIKSSANVSNAGTVYAEGKAMIDTRGSLENTGVLMSGRTLQTQAGSLKNAGSIAAGAAADGKVKTADDLSIAAAGDMWNSGRILAGNNLTLAGKNLVLDNGKLTAVNQAVVNAAANLDNRNGQILANNIMLSAAGKLDNSGGVVESRELLTISAPRIDNTRGVLKQTADADAAGKTVQGIVINNRKADAGTASQADKVQRAQDILINDQGFIASHASTTIHVQAISNIDGTVQSKAELTINGGNGIDNTKGKLLSTEALSVTTDGKFINNGGKVSGDQALSLSAKGDLVNNNEGSIQGTSVRLAAASIDNSKGRLVQTGAASQAIELAGSFKNVNGVFSSNAESITLKASSIDNSQGDLLHGGNGTLTLNVAESVNNTQGVVAGNGNMVIDGVNAKVTNVEGTISSIGNTSLTANVLDNTSGTLATDGEMALHTAGELNNRGGTIGTNGSLTLTAGTVENGKNGVNAAGRIAAAGTKTMSVTVAGELNNADGFIAGNGDVNLTADGVVNTKGTIVAKDKLEAKVAAGFDNREGTLLSEGRLKAYFGGALENRNGLVQGNSLDLQAGSIVNTAGIIQQVGNGAAGTAGTAAIAATGVLDNSQGKILNEGSSLRLSAAAVDNNAGMVSAKSGLLDIQSGGALNNASGTIYSAGSTLSIAAGSLDNSEGDISHSGQRKLAVESLGLVNNNGGKILSVGDIEINAHSVTNNTRNGEAGLIQSGKDALLSAAVDMNNAGGSVVSNGALSVRAAGNIDNRGGAMEAAKALALQGTDIANTGGRIASIDNSGLSVNAGRNFNNNQGMAGGNGAVMLSAGAISNIGGKVIAQVNLDVTAGAMTNDDGNMAAGDALTAQVTGALNNVGGNIQASRMALAADSLHNRGGKLLATGTDSLTVSVKNDADNSAGFIGGNGDVALAAKNIANAGGTVYAKNDLGIDSNKLANIGGTLEADGKLAVNAAQELVNRQGLMQASAFDVQAPNLDNGGGKILQLGSGDTRFVFAGALHNAKGLIATNGADLTLAAASIDNSEGDITHAGNGKLDIGSNGAVNNNAGKLRTAGAVMIDAKMLASDGGLIQSSKAAAISATGDIGNAGGSIFSGAALTVQAAGKLNNSGGTMEAANALILQAADIDNTKGRVASLDSSGIVIGAGGTLANNEGRIGGNGAVTLDAGVISNKLGKVTGVSNIGIAANSVDNKDGIITAGGALTAQVAGALDTVGGAIQATQVAITANSLDNSTGKLLATGAKPFVVTVGGNANNTGGFIGGNGDVALTAKKVVNTGGTVYAKSDLDIGAGELNNTAGTLQADGTLTVAVTQELTNRQGVMQAQQFALQAPSLDNSAGRILQTGAGDTALVFNGAIKNAKGTIATNGANLALHASAIDNSQGEVTHTGSGKLDIDTAALGNNGGTLRSGGEIAIDAHSVASVAGLIESKKNAAIVSATDIDNTGGSIVSGAALAIHAQDRLANIGGTLEAAKALALQADGIDNTKGRAVSLDNSGAVVHAANALSNREGTIGGNGAVALSAASLDNTKGHVTGIGNVDVTAPVVTNTSGVIKSQQQLTLDLGAAGFLSNTRQGVLQGEKLNLNTPNLSNAGGSIIQTGNSDTHLQVNGTLDNAGGAIASNGSKMSISAQAIANEGGLIKHGGSHSLTLAMRGAIGNSGGAISSNGNAVIGGAAIINTNGAITADNLQIDTQGHALDNADGKIAARGALAIRSGQLNNRAGLLQANGALTVNTNGQALINTQSGSTNGIAGMNRVTLTTGSLNNQDGYLGAKGALSVSATGVNNSRGAIVGESAVTVAAGSLNNTGGQIQGKGNVALNLGSGTLDNSNGLALAAGTLTVNAGRIDNSNTATAGSADKGLQGRNVSLSAAAIDNTNGAIRADNQLTLAGGNLNNSGGTVSSANTVVNHTGSINNAQGTLIAAKKLMMNSVAINGVGQYLSHGDLDFNHSDAYTNTSRIVASGNLTINSGGTLTNSGQIGANHVLNLGAVNLNNLHTGEIKAGAVNITVSNALTNHGIIDGGTVNIDAGGGTVTNTNRIYGDTLGVNAGAIDNRDQATIGARHTLALTADNITNRTDSTILSTGDMTLTAPGKVINRSGRIEAFGNLAIHAGGVENRNDFLTMATQVVGTENIVGHVLRGDITPLAAGTYAFNGIDHGRLVLDSPLYPLAKYGASPYRSAVIMEGNDDSGYTYKPYYAPEHPRWALFDVTPPGPAPFNPWQASICNGDGTPSFCYAAREAYNAWEEQALERSRELDEKIFAFNRNLRGRMVEDWYDVNATRTITETRASGDSRPGQIFVGGHLVLNGPGGSVLNDKSQIVVGGSVSGSARDIVQNEDKNVRQKTDVGTWRLTEIVPSGWFGDHKRAWDAPGPYSVVHTPEYTGGATVWQFKAGAAPALSGRIGARQAVLVGQAANGAADANGNIRHRQGASGDSDGAGVSGASVARFNGPPGSKLPGVAGTPAPTVAAIGNAGVTGSGPDASIPAADATAGAANAVGGAVNSRVAGTVQPAPVAVANGIAEGADAPRSMTAAAQPTALPGLHAAAAPAIGVAHQQPVEIKAAGNSNLTVRSIAPTLAIPAGTLFATRPEPGTGHLVETDPRFTDYRTWLSSDFMLRQLGNDPAGTLKRLGDGFYEQKLVADQIIYTTGHRFVGDYRSNEEQYQALMQAGVAFGKKFQLTVGVALTEEQMRQLTGDLVWLVRQEVRLPDGSVQSVLAPQVYVRVKEGDIQGDGTLIAAREIKLDLTGDLSNNALIATRDLMDITAHNIDNVSGGRLSGDTVNLAAREDLTNLSGAIAGNAVMLDAGRDIAIRTRTIDTAGLNTTRTGTGETAGVTGETLTISAGRDLSVAGARIEAGKDALLTAGRHLSIGTVQTGGTMDIAVSGHVKAAEVNNVGSLVSAGNHLIVAAGRKQDGDLKVIGSTLSAGKDLTAIGANVTIGSAVDTLDVDIFTKRRNATDTALGHQESAVTSRLTAGKDILIAATGSPDAQSKVQAGTGDLLLRGAALQSTVGQITLAAHNDIQLVEQQLASRRRETHQYRGGTLVSKKSVDANSNVQGTQSVGNTVSGDRIVMDAGRDLLARATTVVGTGDVSLAAKNDITLASAQAVSEETRRRQEKTSGLFSSGGASITLGKQQIGQDRASQNVTHTGSRIASLEGKVGIDAGQAYTQTASQVLALQGDIDIAAKKIDINAAHDSAASRQKDKNNSSGLTLAVSSPLISALETVDKMADAAGNTDDPRMKALAAATTVMAAKNAADAASQNGQGASVTLTLTVGSSKSESSQTQSGTAAAGSTVAAGNNVSLTAKGDGKDSDINIIGSNIKAGNDATLKAEGDLLLQAAQSTSELQRASKSSSAGVGIYVSFGQNTGFGLTANASAARGNADGKDVIHSNTHVEAGNTLTLSSGSDTTLKGAVAGGRQVIADVGAGGSGNLAIESLQDTSTFHSKDKSAGGSISVGFSTQPVSGSISVSKGNIDSTYASVVEQSGIKAGDGGFQVRVEGKTDLKGGVIAGSDQALAEGKNRFDGKGEVTQSDIVNTAAYSAESVGVSVGMGSSTGASAGFGKDSGNATTVTQAGIGVSTSEDTTAAIKPIFDAAKVQAEVSAQVQITQAFSQEAPKAVASYAGGKADELKKQVAAETDPEKKKALEAEQRKWEEGGLYRVALHTATGALSGGASGAVGAAVSAGTADLMNDLQAATQKALQEAGLESGSAKAVAQGVAGLTAAGLGGLAGGAQGAGAALTVDVNNRQLHQSEYDFAKKNAKAVAEKLGISEKEAEGRIVAEILRNSDQQTAQATDGKHDYEVRSLLGCQNLNCNGYKNDPNYADHSFNAQLIAPNQTAYNLGQVQLGTGQTYNQRVESNIKNNPVSSSIAGLVMIGYGGLTGGTGAAVGIKLIGGGIGAAANAGFQTVSGQSLDWTDIGIAGLTGFITTGAGLGSSLLTNSGGALVGAGIKGENPNAGMAAAAIGTGVGYGIGKAAEIPLEKRINPWWRPEWIDIGLGMSKFNPRNPLPGITGNVFSSGTQEKVGDDVKKQIQR